MDTKELYLYIQMATILYVGMSIKGGRRINDHKNDKHLQRKGKYDRYSMDR